MRADFVNPFLHSVVHIMRTMADTQPKLGKPSVKQDTTARGVITGIIDLMGEKTAGSMSITFNNAAVLDISYKILGEKKKVIDSSIEDLVGEITSMISGGARKILAENGFNFYLSQPVIMKGVGHKIEHSNVGPTIMLPFTLPKGQFTVEVCFREETPQKLPDYIK